MQCSFLFFLKSEMKTKKWRQVFTYSSKGTREPHFELGTYFYLSNGPWITCLKMPQHLYDSSFIFKAARYHYLVFHLIFSKKFSIKQRTSFQEILCLLLLFEWKILELCLDGKSIKQLMFALLCICPTNIYTYSPEKCNFQSFKIGDGESFTLFLLQKSTKAWKCVKTVSFLFTLWNKVEVKVDKCIEKLLFTIRYFSRPLIFK